MRNIMPIFLYRFGMPGEEAFADSEGKFVVDIRGFASRCALHKMKL